MKPLFLKDKTFFLFLSAQKKRRSSFKTWHDAWITPTRLADGFGHPKLPYLKIRIHPKNGSPVSYKKFGDVIILFYYTIIMIA